MTKTEFQRFMAELDLLVSLREPRTPVEIGLWARLLSPHGFDDACAARDECFAEGVRFPTPGDILKRIKNIRAYRLAVHGPVLPSVDPDDVSAYQAERRGLVREIAGSPVVRGNHVGGRVLEA